MNFFIETIIFILTLLFLKKQEKEVLENELMNADIGIMLCRLDKIDNMFYIWELPTNKFLLQSESMDEIVDFFMKKYPGKKVLFAEAEDKI